MAKAARRSFSEGGLTPHPQHHLQKIKLNFSQLKQQRVGFELGDVKGVFPLHGVTGVQRRREGDDLRPGDA